MKRIFVDILILAVFLAVMSFHHLPKILHEVLGVLFPLVVIVHLCVNRRWFFSLRKGQWGVMRILGTGVDFLMLLCFAVVVVSGICMSNYLFRDMIPLSLQRNITLHQLHVSLPFLMLILMGIHLGLHWQSWRQRLKSFLPRAEKSHFQRVGSTVIGFAFIGAGIYGSLQNRVGDRLLLKHIFATPATDLPGSVYVLLLFAIFAMYACLGNWMQEMTRHGWRKL